MKSKLQEDEKKSSWYQDQVKRKLDIALSAASLPVLLPVIGVLSAAIVVDDPGPIFFMQKRVGKKKDGRISYFPILKFRTMKTDTPHDIPTHLLKDPEQYITRVGRILRKTSLDELPQIFNILGGDMSFIGPRPALWNQKDLIREREKYGANDVMPGLTGWAQCNGRDELSIEEKAKFDGYYTKHLNFPMDVRCFLKTVEAVLEEKGVSEGGPREAAKDSEKVESDSETLKFDETSEFTEQQKENSSKKRYLFITNHSYMFWQFRRELLKKLLDEDNEIYLATPFNGHEDDFAEMGCHMIRTNFERRGVNPVAEEKLFHQYLNMMKEIRPDLVVTYSIKPNIYAGLAASLLNIPYCVNVQGLGTAFEKPGMAAAASALYHLACRKASCVFFENERNADYFTGHHIVAKDKVKVLRGAGVNLKYFSYHKPVIHGSHKAPGASDAKAEQDGKFHFLYLGRIMKEKGMDELFAAVRRLADECVRHSEDPEQGSVYGKVSKEKASFPFVLDLVGFYEDEYEEEVKELEEQGVVHFYGFQSDPRPYYINADCVVLPSYHEGMSNVLLEAAATGRMLITSAIPGCREAVDQGKSGFLCHAKDAESLYRVMRHVLQLPESEVEEMGRAGRRKMEQEFDRNKIVEETVKVLCSQSGTTGG